MENIIIVLFIAWFLLWIIHGCEVEKKLKHIEDDMGKAVKRE